MDLENVNKSQVEFDSFEDNTFEGEDVSSAADEADDEGGLFSFVDIEEDEMDITWDFQPVINHIGTNSFDELFFDTEDETISEITPSPGSNHSEDVFSDLLFQHLAGTELLVLSEVNRSIYKKIGCSEKCMNKIVLKIEFCEPQDSGVGLIHLGRSRRQYSEVSISIMNNKELERKVEAILKKFEKSIQNLKMIKVGGFNSILNKPMSLFKLQSLELHIVSGRFTGVFLENVCTLRKLVVNGLDSKVLQSCLEQNPHLEELELYENSFVSYFNQRFESHPFVLKKLSIFDHLETMHWISGEFAASTWNAADRLNFTSFLAQQADSLRSLHIEYCFAEDLHRILRTLPGLRCLEVNSLIGEPTKLRLKTNQSITTFLTKSADDQYLHTFIATFKNLSSLFINNLKTHQFFYIMSNAKALKFFGYFWASATEKKHGNFIDLKKLYTRSHAGETCRNVIIQAMKKEKFIEMHDIDNQLE